MPSEKERQEALVQISEYIEITGDEIVSEIDDTDDQGNQIDGYIAGHGTHSYAVITHADQEYARIQFEYSLINEYLRQQAAEVFESTPPDGGEVEVTDEMRERAEQQLVSWAQEINDDAASKLEYKVSELLSHPEVAYNLNQMENGRIHGFVVTRKLYPYDEDLTASEFGHSVQAVISIGNHGQNFMQRATGWQVTGTGTEQGEELSGETPERDRTFY